MELKVKVMDRSEGFKEALAQCEIVARQTSPLIHVLTTLTKIKKRLRPKSRGRR